MARHNRILIRSQRQCNRARQMIARLLIDQKILIEIATIQETLSEEILIHVIILLLSLEMTSETIPELQVILTIFQETIHEIFPETILEMLHVTIRLMLLAMFPESILETTLEMLQEVTRETMLETTPETVPKILEEPIPVLIREDLKEVLTATKPPQFLLHLQGLVSTSTIRQSQHKITRLSTRIQTRTTTKTRTIRRLSGAINLSADHKNHRARKIRIRTLRVREYQTRLLQMNAARIRILQTSEIQIRTAIIPTIEHRQITEETIVNRKNLRFPLRELHTVQILMIVHHLQDSKKTREKPHKRGRTKSQNISPLLLTNS